MNTSWEEFRRGAGLTGWGLYVEAGGLREQACRQGDFRSAVGCAWDQRGSLRQAAGAATSVPFLSNVTC